VVGDACDDEWVDTGAWQQAGLYDPDATGAEERRALLEYLADRGATLDQLIEAHRLGNLPAVAGDLVLRATPASLSIAEVAARSGVPVERVARILLASGLPVASDTQLPADLDGVIQGFEGGVAVLGEDAVVAFTRVLGAAAITISEAAVALFYAEVGPGTGRAGPDELSRARMAEQATAAFAAVPDVLARLLLAQFERTTHRSAVARGSLDWTADPDHRPPDPGPTERVAVGFVDLVGSTAWAEQLSLRDQSLALSRFESAAWSSAVQTGGRVVKMIGDEVFFTAPTVDAACRIGTEVCQAAAADPQLPPARGAVGWGVVNPREGDYFGPLVNLVSRLVKAADPGTLVVTREVADGLDPDRWSRRELAPEQLRGISTPVRVYAVAPASDGSAGQ
jgi:adenylate cyclase